MQSRLNNTHFRTSSPRGTGFTLIEVLLSVSMSAVILSALSSFFILSRSVEERGRTIQEVEHAGFLALAEITAAVRSADAITSPVPGGTADTLTLDVADAVRDPTVFSLSGGELRISEGASSPVPLTGARVAVSNLAFRNLSRPGTRGTIQVSFTVVYNDVSGGRVEYSASESFIASASLR